jgi:hypothetical protein
MMVSFGPIVPTSSSASEKAIRAAASNSASLAHGVVAHLFTFDQLRLCGKVIVKEFDRVVMG